MVLPKVYTYAYDAAGRLTQAVTGIPLSCPDEHDYQFDADTNRTQFKDVNGCPGYTTTTTKNSTYDAADRATITGYNYDAFGRTTAVPAADSGTGNSDTLTYFANDMVNTMTSNATTPITVTNALDANERLATFVSSANSKLHTNHYSNDSDSPTWTDEWTGGTTVTWNRYLQGFGDMSAVANQADAISLELANIHGDVFATIPSTATSYTGYTTTETDEYGKALGTPVRYDYLGTAQRRHDGNTGLMLMGQRLYNPAAGRFLQTDLVLGGSANNYDYVNGDPVNGLDLDGTCNGKHHSGWNPWGYVRDVRCRASHVVTRVNNVATGSGWNTHTNMCGWCATSNYAKSRAFGSPSSGAFSQPFGLWANLLWFFSVLKWLNALGRS